MLNKVGPQSVRILKYILHYQDRKGYPPSLLEICQRLHFKSANTASYHLARMESAGIVKREKGRARCLQIVDIARAIQLVNHSGGDADNHRSDEAGSGRQAA
jgi:repressor LexA